MTKITIVLKKDKVTKANQAPIHFRIIKNRKVNYIASGIAVPPHLWDKNNKQVKKGVANSGRINAFLSQRLADLQAVSLQLETTNPKLLTSKKLKNIICGGDQVDFIKFANDFIEGYKIGGQIGTYDRFRSVVNKLKTYMKEKPLYFSDMDYEFVSKYERYLLEDLKNKINTVHNNLKAIRRLFNAAYDRDIIELNTNPFLKFKLKMEKTFRTFLDEEEIQKIEDVNLDKLPRIKRARAMCIWAMYAGGLRISDLLLLKWENYDGVKINFTIKKTNQQHSIKIPNHFYNPI
jgi:integrase/recombinase XerD